MERKKNRKRALIVVLCCLLAAVCALLFYRSQNPAALAVKRAIKYQLINLNPPKEEDETVGFGTVLKRLLITDGAENSGKFDSARDNKRLYYSDEAVRLINYPDGYRMDLPADAAFDFALSPCLTRVSGADWDMVISREYSPYQSLDEAIGYNLKQLFPMAQFDDGIDQYIGYYLNRFLLSGEWESANRVTVDGPQELTVNGCESQLITATVQELWEGLPDRYYYLTVRTDGRDFFRVMCRCKSTDEKTQQQLLTAMESLCGQKKMGEAVYTTDWRPILPREWNDETRTLYEEIAAEQQVRWGIFASDIYGNGIDNEVPKIEKEVDYHFSVILSYAHFGSDFPTEFMQKCYDQGRVVELTYQMTESNNENLYGVTPNLDVYRGLRDEDIRRFARQAAEFGHPFLFRLNNEMNSDWTSYGGVVNMSDPQIFIDNWRRFYRIFQEEGVTNCIWIFNPNDRNAPPCRWNDSMAYYPGDEYVQMLGVTGYNNGTYYKKWAEEWREFEAIYDNIDEKYGTVFQNFPWIITEFASSSVGGDKVKWMERMFTALPKYDKIKIAVWFSHADFDGNPDAGAPVARPYWLDETEKTAEAFRNGVAGNGAQYWDWAAKGGT